MLKGDRIDILVEDEGESKEKVKNGESLCPNRVRQNLDSVGDLKWSKPNAAGL